MSSPRHWDVALFPEDFAPSPTPAETGLACPVQWAFPPSLHILESRATKFRVLAFAEAGDTVTADHFLQMATFFFHEYGRRVGMVPRSSLKEGKYNQMVEKRTKTTQQQTKQNQPQPTGRDSTTK